MYRSVVRKARLFVAAPLSTRARAPSVAGVLAVLVTVPAGVAAAAATNESSPTASVEANGNPFTPGSMNFSPARVAVGVGHVVRWTNTDQFVPHTATEDHRLWNLGGDYGPPGGPSGFGPGESVERRFEAGTHHYFCEIHPEAMRGVVEVPVRLTRLPSRRARATWSRSAPADGLVFDLQRRRNGRVWAPWQTATRSPDVRFRLGRRRARWEVRARLRSASDPAKATDWSPVAALRVRALSRRAGPAVGRRSPHG